MPGPPALVGGLPLAAQAPGVYQIVGFSPQGEVARCARAVEKFVGGGDPLATRPQRRWPIDASVVGAQAAGPASANGCSTRERDLPRGAARPPSSLSSNQPLAPC